MSSFLLVVLGYTASLGRLLGSSEVLCFVAFISFFFIFRRLCYYRKFRIAIYMLAPLAAIYLKHPFVPVFSKFDQYTVFTACWFCLFIATVAWRFIRRFAFTFNPFGRGLIGRALLYCFLGMLLLYFYDSNLFMRIFPTSFSKDSALFAMLLAPVAMTMMRSVRGIAPLAFWGGLGFLLLSSQNNSLPFSSAFNNSGNKRIVKSMASGASRSNLGLGKIGDALKKDVATGLGVLGIRL